MSNFYFMKLVEFTLTLVLDLLQADVQIAAALLPW